MNITKAGVKLDETMPGGVQFLVSANLVRTADLKATAWPGQADSWRVTVDCTKGGQMVLDYHTGIGHRVLRSDSGMTVTAKRLPTRPTVWEWDRSVPVHPSARSVLGCIASDWQAAEEMPRGDAGAMDYLQSEFGHDVKGSDLLRFVYALRKIHDDVAAMLRGSGVTPAEFAAWASELGS